MGNRGGGSFAHWYQALPKGKKFVVSLGLALLTILSPALILSELVAPLLESDTQQLFVTCGDQQTSFTIPKDNLVRVGENQFQLKSGDLEPLVEGACAALPSDS